MFARLAAMRWLALLLAAICGCAYRPVSHTPNLIASPPPAAAVSPKDVGISLHARYLQFHQPLGPSIEKWWAKRQGDLISHTQERARSLPSLREARWNDSSADCQVVIEVTSDTRGNKFLHGVTEFTKYLIPSKDEGVVRVEARVYRSGNLLKTYEAEGVYETRRHLIFLLLPMGWRKGVPARVTNDTISDALLQVDRDAAEWAGNG